MAWRTAKQFPVSQNSALTALLEEDRRLEEQITEINRRREQIVEEILALAGPAEGEVQPPTRRR